MKRKLYANMRRMTTVFCCGILCVTACVAALRLTVFSDMAVVASTANSQYVMDHTNYSLNDTVYFSSATAKGDIFIANLFSENLIHVQVKVADTGELIMSTGLMNPGSEQPSIRMNPTGQKLADGHYACIAEVATYAPDNIKTSIAVEKIPIEIYIGKRPAKS